MKGKDKDWRGKYRERIYWFRLLGVETRSLEGRNPCPHVTHGSGMRRSPCDPHGMQSLSPSRHIWGCHATHYTIYCHRTMKRLTLCSLHTSGSTHICFCGHWGASNGDYKYHSRSHVIWSIRTDVSETFLVKKIKDTNFREERGDVSLSHKQLRAYKTLSCNVKTVICVYAKGLASWLKIFTYSQQGLEKLTSGS